LQSDPCAEDGCLWFFNFFFFNKKLKRIVFLSCRCTSKPFSNEEDEDEMAGDEEDEMVDNTGSNDQTTSSLPLSTTSSSNNNRAEDLLLFQEGESGHYNTMIDLMD
jgi:hypothetical protein